jgi:hypothetical protein
MCNVFLRSWKVSVASAFVQEAESWARALVRSECRFPGDYSNAMRRVAGQIRVPLGVLWNLHYRQPKTIGVENYAALGAAYIPEQRQKYKESREAIVGCTALGEALIARG